MNECIFCNAECEGFVCKECANKEFEEFWKIEEYSKAIKEEFSNKIDEVIMDFLEMDRTRFLDIMNGNKTAYSNYFDNRLVFLIIDCLKYNGGYLGMCVLERFKSKYNL